VDVVRAAEAFQADLVALSSLMLPSLPYARDTIEMIKMNERLRERVKVMVGGGPVSEDWALEVGADGYGDDAIEAVDLALRLMDQMEKR
jgi:methanogenic corrinoid protein MtbC1